MALPFLIVLLLALAAYAALWWYPARNAAVLMDPSAGEFVAARRAYLAVVNGYPDELSAATLDETAGGMLEGAGTARPVLTDSQATLERRNPLTVPVIKGREPLPTAHRIRQRMIDFYIGALELITDVESIARYLNELGPLLPKADDLKEVLGSPKTPDEVDEALAAARPIADQLLADVEALTAPVELGSVHEALKAIASRTRTDLDELDQVTGRGAGPILQTLVKEMRRQLKTFRETILSSPAEATKAGLAARIDHLGRVQQRIIDGLAELHDDYGLDVTVPAA